MTNAPDREISLEELRQANRAVRRELVRKGLYPERTRIRLRTEEKERALLRLRVAWIKKYGVKRTEDGEYILQSMYNRESC